MQRAWWPLVVLLLAAMGAVMVYSATLENQTWDESSHLIAGYTHVRLGDHRWNWEHPPLGKFLDALPLLFLDPALPVDSEPWKIGDSVAAARIFLYQNTVDPDTLLFTARLPTILLTLILGLALALWVRKHWGLLAAAVSLLFFASDPNIIAHGRYVTTDLIATLTIFLAAVAWGRFLDSNRRIDLVLAGIALGLALASKYSALFLLGLLPLLYLIEWWRKPRHHSAQHLVASLSTAGAVGVAVLLITYGPHSWSMLFGPPDTPLKAFTTPETAVGRTLAWMGDNLGVPSHTYLRGLNVVAEHNHNGHPSYLLGEVSRNGRWYYFPAAIAVKTPTALLALIALGCILLVLCAARGGQRWLRGSSTAGMVLLVTPLFFLALAMAGNLNLGLRHVLPIYPFLFAAAGIAVAQRPIWWALLLLLAVQVYEHASISPHYLAFFNSVSGGPANGPTYLADSNIDWGQDAKKLGRYMSEHDIDEVCIAFFGNTDLDYYSVHHRQLPLVEEDGPKPDCVAALSVTELLNVYSAIDLGAWFRKREPDARIGYSIYLYDLRKAGKEGVEPGIAR